MRCQIWSKIKTILAFAVIILFTANCPPGPQVSENPMGTGLIFCLMYSDVYDTHDATDMKDGTVRFRAQTLEKHSCLGEYLQTAISTSYVKKCLQGQVYRPAQNDCQGAGTLGNNWNAATFQYCTAPDNSCELTGYYTADPTISPAAVECAGDTTAGRQWQLMGLEGYYYNINLSQYFPDIPLGSPNAFWSHKALSSDITLAASSWIDSSTLMLTGNSNLKTDSLYVLCSTGWN